LNIYLKLFVMKTKFTFLLLLLVTTGFFSLISSAQVVGDYRSAGTGNWNTAATWERFDGLAWVAPAPAAPGTGDETISIRNTHVVTVSTPVTADQIVVDAGGTLSVNTGGANNLTLNNGTGDDLIIDGTFNIGGNSLLGVTASVLVNGTMNWGTAAVTYQPITIVSATGIVNLTGNTSKNIESNFTNNGTFNWATGASAGGILIANSSTFTNNGTLNEQFQSNRGFLNTSVGSFINNGIFNKTTVNPFNNNSVAFTNSATGIMRGIGTYTISGTFTNSGTVAPGNSPGILIATAPTLVGQPATVAIEILDASGAGTGHDRLDVSSATNMDGVTITVTDISPVLTPAPLGNYTIMQTTAGNFSGTPTFNMPTNYTVVSALPLTGNTIVIQKIALFPLPLVWGDFTALARNNQVKLTWTTLQETNVSHFNVEYSTDGRTYNAIATLTAAGNTSGTTTYNFTHGMPDLQKNNFYRITQTDFDGKSTQSATRLVRFKTGKVVAVVATPNPMREKLQLAVQGEGIRVVLNDLNGRQVRVKNVAPGNHEINVSDLAPGMYQLSVFEKGELIETQKLLKL
jgi:hypothetical protein